MIARLPGRIAANSVNDTPSYFADWFPTLCDAAGIGKPTGLDGESLWSELTRATSSEASQLAANRKPMIWVFPEYGGQVAVRIGTRKAVRQGLKTKTPGEWEVYDIANDRAESRNLASAESTFVKEVEALLRQEVTGNPRFQLDIPNVVPIGLNNR